MVVPTLKNRNVASFVFSDHTTHGTATTGVFFQTSAPCRHQVPVWRAKLSSAIKVNKNKLTSENNLSLAKIVKFSKDNLS